jgi:hypothetical protein
MASSDCQKIERSDNEMTVRNTDLNTPHSSRKTYHNSDSAGKPGAWHPQVPKVQAFYRGNHTAPIRDPKNPHGVETKRRDAILPKLAC